MLNLADSGMYYKPTQRATWMSSILTIQGVGSVWTSVQCFYIDPKIKANSDFNSAYFLQNTESFDIIQRQKLQH